MKLIDLTNKRFNRWTVIQRAPNQGRHVSWYCRCSCGTERIVSSTNLINGTSQSCGCYHIDVIATHSDTGSPEYRTWTAMKARCYTRSNIGYPSYGGRGITVCERWRDSFQNFLDDMGRKPGHEYSLDRIDPNGDYSPDNCRWATRLVQNNNMRSNTRIIYNGITKTVAQWARELGVSKGLILYRLHAGWSLEDTFTKPSHRST